MLTPLPGEEGFDKYNNAFSLEQVRRIGDEYGCKHEEPGDFQKRVLFRSLWDKWKLYLSAQQLESVDHELKSRLYQVWSRENKRVDSGVQLFSVDVASFCEARDLGDTAPALAAQRHILR